MPSLDEINSVWSSFEELLYLELWVNLSYTVQSGFSQIDKIGNNANIGILREKIK